MYSVKLFYSSGFSMSPRFLSGRWSPLLNCNIKNLSNSQELSKQLFGSSHVYPLSRFLNMPITRKHTHVCCFFPKTK